MKEAEDKNVELKQEIKLLKRLQYHQGNRLLDIEGSEQYPVKIKQLMEERKFAQEKLTDTKNKIKIETAQLKRQSEIIEAAESSMTAIRDELGPLLGRADWEQEEAPYADEEDKELNYEIA